ncbi:MAG: hypothetical protein CMC70_00780 [Flavobacteriaceae bacterium]|nr:hypothetical protein [Flavobacteriaceae bacterium]
MNREKLLIQRTLQSLLKYGAFLVVILMVVFACSNTSDTNEETIAQQPVANLTVKTDGAIMGSVIAPNSEIVIKASNSEDIIKGTTDENGEFFINGFEEGTYTVTITTSTTNEVETFNDVKVNIGEVTALGTVTFAAQ